MQYNNTFVHGYQLAFISDNSQCDGVIMFINTPTRCASYDLVGIYAVLTGLMVIEVAKCRTKVVSSILKDYNALLYMYISYCFSLLDMIVVCLF